MPTTTSVVTRYPLVLFNTHGFLGAFATETPWFKYLYLQVHSYNFGHSDYPRLRWIHARIICTMFLYQSGLMSRHGNYHFMLQSYVLLSSLPEYIFWYP